MTTEANPCGLCEDPMTPEEAHISRDLDMEVCHECSRNMGIAVEALKREGIIGIHKGPFSGNSNG